ENKLSRDRRTVVDLLNSNGVGRTMPLQLFIGRYQLDADMIQQIREELFSVLFIKTPDGERDLGPLVLRAQKYPTETILVVSEDGKNVETLTVYPTTARGFLYGVIIEAVQDGTFRFLQESCRNCHRCYWRRGDYCSLLCGREYNTKTAGERMKRYRLKLKKKGEKNNHGNR